MFKILLCFVFIRFIVVLEAKQIAPNVLFIMLDDFRSAVGKFGDTLAKTPNMDSLMDKSFYFPNIYAQVITKKNIVHLINKYNCILVMCYSKHFVLRAEILF